MPLRVGSGSGLCVGVAAREKVRPDGQPSSLAVAVSLRQRCTAGRAAQPRGWGLGQRREEEDKVRFSVPLVWRRLAQAQVGAVCAWLAGQACQREQDQSGRDVEG